MDQRVFPAQEGRMTDNFIEYKSRIENQTGHRIKSLQSNNGKEFCNNRMHQLLEESENKRRLTASHTPQQNRVQEGQAFFDQVKKDDHRKVYSLRKGVVKNLEQEVANTEVEGEKKKITHKTRFTKEMSLLRIMSKREC